MTKPILLPQLLEKHIFGWDARMKKRWVTNADSSGVSPVIATILLVGITVVLAATLYVMVFGFGADTNNAPVADITKESVEDGFRFKFTPFSKETSWSDISIVLTAESASVSFDNITTEVLLSESGSVTAGFGSRDLGGLTVFLNATDQAGNGLVNQGDSFTLTTGGGEISNNVTYEVFVIYDPNGAVITSMTFQG